MKQTAAVVLAVFSLSVAAYTAVALLFPEDPLGGGEMLLVVVAAFGVVSAVRWLWLHRKGRARAEDVPPKRPPARRAKAK